MLYSIVYPFFWQLDASLFYWVNHLPHSALLNAAATWLHYGTRGALIYIPFALILLFNKKTRLRALVIIGAGLINTIVIDLILKHLAHRPRPYEQLTRVIVLPPLPHSFSFPSGEAAMAFAIAAICNLVFPGKAWRLLWLWALIVALDRIYMGHHYPSDVLFGALVGIAIAYGVKALTAFRFPAVFANIKP